MKAQKTASGTFSYFTVLYPNGTVAVFGSQTNTSDCLVYPISKSTDVLGNMVSFSYAYQNNRYRILNIEYGAHTSSDTPLANIAFTYKDRVDVLSGFEGETEVKLFHLLDNIKCYHGIELLHTYSFVYKTSNVSLLTRIDCDNLNPLLFYYGYDNNMNGWEKQKAILTRYFNQDTDLVVNKVKFESGTEDDGLFRIRILILVLYLRKGIILLLLKTKSYLYIEIWKGVLWYLQLCMQSEAFRLYCRQT